MIYTRLKPRTREPTHGHLARGNLTCIRIGGNTKHHFGELLFIAVSALICGVPSFAGMVEFAHLYEDWLKKWIRLPNGIPVPQTMTKPFSVLDTKTFSKCVANHVGDLLS